MKFVLTYHYCKDRKTRFINVSESLYSISKEQLIREMEYLISIGSKFHHLKQYNSIDESGLHVFVNVDGGNYLIVNTLLDLGIPFTLFLVTQKLNQTQISNMYPSDWWYDHTEYLDNNLIEVGSHSHSHQSFQNINFSNYEMYKLYVENEISSSINILNKYFKKNIFTFALPFGNLFLQSEINILGKICSENKIQAIRMCKKLNLDYDHKFIFHCYEGKNIKSLIGLKRLMEPYSCTKKFALKIVYQCLLFACLCLDVGPFKSLQYYYVKKVSPKLWKLF